MPVDPLIAPLLDALNNAPRPEFSNFVERREAARRRPEDPSPYATFMETEPPVATVTEVTIPVRHPAGSVPALVYRNDAAIEGRALGALVMYHGGGWFMGSIYDSDVRCRMIAGNLDVVVVNVEYRLAPEFPFPTPAEDAYDAACWVSSHLSELGVTTGWLGTTGESAGGNLSAAVALLARERGGPSLALQVMEIPGLDLTLGSPSLERYGRGHILDKDELVLCVANYLGGSSPEDPIASPVLAPSLAGLPPAAIFTAECDPLADDGRRYAERLRDAGVPVIFREFEGQVHGSLGLTALLPSAREWRASLLDAIRNSLSVTAAS